jgi:hypothetical protein
MSKICNDATLILRRMSCLQQRDWPDFAAQENKEALEKAATDTFRFTKNILEATKQGNDTKLTKILCQGTTSICQHVTTRNGKDLVYELNLSGASDAFLELATNIEMLLMELLPQHDEALSAPGQDEGLPSMMGNMKLGPPL